MIYSTDDLDHLIVSGKEQVRRAVARKAAMQVRRDEILSEVEELRQRKEQAERDLEVEKASLLAYRQRKAAFSEQLVKLKKEAEKVRKRREEEEAKGMLLSILDVRKAVSFAAEIPEPALMGNARARHISHPRQMAFLLAYSLTGKSLPIIGRYFKRDHSTVLHGIKVARERILSGDKPTTTLLAASCQVLSVDIEEVLTGLHHA